MIGKLLNGLLKFVISGITIILSPLDNYILNNLPSLNDALTAINSMINYVINFIGYVVDLSGLTSVALLLIIGYYTFAIGGTLLASGVKLVIKWYKAIVP